MKRPIAWLLIFGLAAAGCSAGGGDTPPAGEDPKSTGAAAPPTTRDLMDRAQGVAKDDAVKACRHLAERGAWGHALEVCKKAHEALPEDLSLEHAYQQARAASQR